MKKICIILIGGLLVSLYGFSQTPLGGSTRSLSVDEANRLNGIAEPTINGKPYSQYKAEQDALKRQREIKKIAKVHSADVVMNRSADAGPAPARVQPKKNTAPENPVLPSKSETKEVEAVTTRTEAKAPSTAPEVPAQFRILTAQEWTGRAVTGERSKSPVEVVMPRSNPGQPLTGEDLTAVKPAVKPSVQKPASRSAAEVERAAHIQENAKTKSTGPNSASSVAPVSPATRPEAATATTSNHQDGRPDKPAVVPAPKEKSEQVPATTRQH